MAGKTRTTVEQKSSLASISTDPLRSFKFHVQISGPQSLQNAYPKLGFMAVSGLSMTTDVIAYRTGGNNVTTQKLPGQSDFSPITLSKGLCPGDQQLLDWMYQMFSVMQGVGQTYDTKTDFRATIDIMLIDHPVTTSTAAVKAIWRVYNAWPTAISFGDLDAGQNMYSVHQMTFAHEGFDFKVAPKSGPTGVSL
ncbi:phage tail protein [Streptomyces sp. UNOC14_S4]|uniref:phage tail protein n=1 Tax=Streptomyces sp. UNOC14_S4 TaxID=2872340 RepID=UPI001E355ADE|nr:phage tail protein [Streptomyces sp. UNOC14_S4]MCC3766041.1 phage tail protein [Streptomyces sp. UNOC14_S4]